MGAAGELRWEPAQGMVTPEAIGWCTVELRNGDDNLLAVTNPIFFS